MVQYINKITSFSLGHSNFSVSNVLYKRMNHGHKSRGKYFIKLSDFGTRTAGLNFGSLTYRDVATQRRRICLNFGLFPMYPLMFTRHLYTRKPVKHLQ